VSGLPYQHSTVATVAAVSQKQKVVFERSFQIDDIQSSLIKEITNLLQSVPSFSLEYASLHSFSKTIGCSYCCSS
jgi:hypothetical protein